MLVAAPVVLFGYGNCLNEADRFVASTKSILSTKLLPPGLATQKSAQAPYRGSLHDENVFTTFLRTQSAGAVTNGSACKRSQFAAIASSFGPFIEDSVEIYRHMGQALTKTRDLLTKSM
jgi:hypothetical protein